MNLAMSLVPQALWFADHVATGVCAKVFRARETPEGFLSSDESPAPSEALSATPELRKVARLARKGDIDKAIEMLPAAERANSLGSTAILSLYRDHLVQCALVVEREQFKGRV